MFPSDNGCDMNTIWGKCFHFWKGEQGEGCWCSWMFMPLTCLCYPFLLPLIQSLVIPMDWVSGLCPSAKSCPIYYLFSIFSLDLITACPSRCMFPPAALPLDSGDSQLPYSMLPGESSPWAALLLPSTSLPRLFVVHYIPGSKAFKMRPQLPCQTFAWLSSNLYLSTLSN